MIVAPKRIGSINGDAKRVCAQKKDVSAKKSVFAKKKCLEKCIRKIDHSKKVV